MIKTIGIGHRRLPDCRHMSHRDADASSSGTEFRIPVRGRRSLECACRPASTPLWDLHPCVAHLWLGVGPAAPPAPTTDTAHHCGRGPARPPGLGRVVPRLRSRASFPVSLSTPPLSPPPKRHVMHIPSILHRFEPSCTWKGFLGSEHLGAHGRHRFQPSSDSIRDSEPACDLRCLEINAVLQLEIDPGRLA